MLNIEKILKKCDLDFETDFLSERLPYIDFKDFTELMEYLNGDSSSNYMQDDLHEYADGLIDIYYYDLRKWAVENYSYIEEAIDELGSPEPFDFHKAIQYGQYKYYTQQCYEDVENFKEWLEENYNF